MPQTVEMYPFDPVGPAAPRRRRRNLALPLLALTLLSILLTACREEDSPYGNVDVMSIASNGLLTVKGWTFDPNVPTGTVNVEVTSDGKAVLPLLPAVKDRPDVGRAFPTAGSQHGFYAQVLLPAGTHEVCVRFINYFGTSGFNTVDCRVLKVTNRTPFGEFESISANPATDRIRVTGWAIDPDTTDPVTILVYNGSNRAATTSAFRYRLDVMHEHPGWGAYHGFDTTISVPPGQHVICVYAVDAQGSPTNAGLGCKIATV